MGFAGCSAIGLSSVEGEQLTNQGVIEQSVSGLRQVAEAGQGIIGYIYPHTPMELILAHGMMPSLLRAVPGVPSGYEASLQTFACSYVRNLYSLREDEQTPPLAGILFPSNTCDSLQNVSDIWRIRFPNDRLLRLTYPVSYGGPDQDAATEYLAEEIRLLSVNIENLFNHRFSPPAFERAVRLVSQFRDAARFIYAARTVKPDVVTYSDVSRLVRNFLTATTEAAVSDLHRTKESVRDSLEEAGAISSVREVLQTLETRRVPPKPIEPLGEGLRILVAGGMVEPDSISALVNEIPGITDNIIVTDLLSFGFKSVFTRNIESIEDPFHEMAASILSAPGEPTQEGLKGRTDFLVGLAKYLRVDGVLIFEQSFCDPDQFEAPSIEHSCRDAQVRTARVPIDPELSDRARMEVRIQSFLESLEDGGGGVT